MPVLSQKKCFFLHSSPSFRSENRVKLFLLLMDEILHQFIPLFTMFYTSQVVQDFFHQQYHQQSLIFFDISSYGPPTSSPTRLVEKKHVEHVPSQMRYTATKPYNMLFEAWNSWDSGFRDLDETWLIINSYIRIPIYNWVVFKNPSQNHQGALGSLGHCSNKRLDAFHWAKTKWGS